MGRTDHEKAPSCSRKHRCRIGDGRMPAGGEGARAGPTRAVHRRRPRRANLAKAIEQLGYAQVKTNFAAVVTAVSAEVGQVVSPGQSVVTVARPDVREAVVDIGPDFPTPLEVGLPFTVGLQLLPSVQV